MKHKRILVIRQDRVGDVVLATPLLRELRKNFPDSFITAMVRKETKDILTANPNINNILLYDREESLLSLIKKLRKYSFDTALLLLPDEKLTWALFLAGIPFRVSVGTKLYQLLTFTRLVSRNKYIPLRHEADYTMDAGKKLGIRTDKIEPEIFLTAEETEEAKTLVPKSGYIIGINPTSGKSAPNWEIDEYYNLTKIILEKNKSAIIYLNMDEGKEPFLQLNNERVIAPDNLSLRRYIQYISRFDVLVSSSTGPMHIAAALKIPTVSLFCPLNACSTKLWGPLGNRAEIILPPEDYCSKKCPGDPHICTFKDGISAEQVADMILKGMKS